MNALDTVIDLLKQVIEHGDVDDGVRGQLEEAVQQLIATRDAERCEAESRKKALFWLGKALEALPEIAKLVNRILGHD